MFNITGRKKGSNPEVCGALIKLVSICQAENNQKPKVGVGIFNHRAGKRGQTLMSVVRSSSWSQSVRLKNSQKIQGFNV